MSPFDKVDHVSYYFIGTKGSVAAQDKLIDADLQHAEMQQNILCEVNVLFVFFLCATPFFSL